MITSHQFRPYADTPHLCVAELVNGETCNAEDTEHADYNPAGGHQMTEHPNYPHTSWNTAESRAQAHSNNNTVFGRLPSIVTVETLAQHCPVEQGRDYCVVCCAVSTDTTAGAAH